MKPIFVFAFLLTCIRGLSQQTLSQIQAKRGVFTERLFLKDRWIDRISTDVTADSANDNVLATGNAVRLATAGNYIKDQLSEAQPANIRIQGTGVVGSNNSYKRTLSSGYPANAYITQGDSHYGLSIQRSSNDKGPAGLVLFKNYATDLNSLNALQFGDSIGCINFSGIAGDNTTVSNAMSLYGFVEKTAPAYVSSGFIFNTTDTNGVNARRMGINAQGNLMIGDATINPYKLNVVNGDVRFGLLSDPNWGEVLPGIDMNGVITKMQPSNGLYSEEGTLYAQPQTSSPGYDTYLVSLTQTGTGNPVATVLENTFGASFTWTRNSVGNYTVTCDQDAFFGYPVMYSHASDNIGGAVSSRLYRTSNNTATLIVRDATLANTDGWSPVSVEIRVYPLN